LPNVARTLNSINHEVNYDALSVEQIEAERNQLKLKVKEMNALINGLIAAQLGTRFDESRVSKKATISQDMGIDLPSLSRETQANSAKIEQLEDELEENLSRLAGLSNLETKVEVGRRVG
jgi:predicted RNase H-like nuclease (RuvC/YqgF family)